MRARARGDEGQRAAPQRLAEGVIGSNEGVCLVSKTCRLGVLTQQCEYASKLTGDSGLVAARRLRLNERVGRAKVGRGAAKIAGCAFG
jgi:hypothetical protein